MPPPEADRRRAVVRWTRIATVVVVGILLVIGLVTGVKAFLYAMVLAAVVITVGVRTVLLQRANVLGSDEDVDRETDAI